MSNNTVINPLQPAWEAAVTNLIASLGNLGAFVVLTFIFYDLPFLVYNTIQFYALKHGWWEKWRIQKGKEPNPELVAKAQGDMAFLHFVYNPAVYSAIYYTWRFFTDFDLASPLPSPLKLLGQYLICIAFEDTTFYWSHRLLHLPSVYKYVHKPHHEFYVPIGIASDYGGYLDNLLEDIIPVFGGSIIFNVHPLAYLLFVFSRASMAFNAHSGYQLPFTIFNLFPSIFQSTRRHDWHHSSNKGSFGSFTNFWDRLMGTDVDFETSFAKASKSE